MLYFYYFFLFSKSDGRDEPPSNDLNFQKNYIICYNTTRKFFHRGSFMNNSSPVGPKDRRNLNEFSPVKEKKLEKAVQLAQPIINKRLESTSNTNGIIKGKPLNINEETTTHLQTFCPQDNGIMTEASFIVMPSLKEEAPMETAFDALFAGSSEIDEEKEKVEAEKGEIEEKNQLNQNKILKQLNELKLFKIKMEKN